MSDVAQIFDSKDKTRARKPDRLGRNELCVIVGWALAASTIARIS